MARDNLELKQKTVAFPCKDCSDRHAGCHAECEKYLEARSQNMKVKDRERKIINDQLDYVRYRIESGDRQRRKKRNG